MSMHSLQTMLLDSHTVLWALPGSSRDADTGNQQLTK